MIDKVEIIIGNGLSNEELIMINNHSKKAYVNDNIVEIPNDFVDRLLDIIKYWKNEYGTNNNIDAKEFNITLYEDNIEEKYHGKGIFPDNFDLLKELLGELHD
jgi:hypothetical protein